VNEQTHTATFTGDYYQFAQVSEFVTPDARRIYSDRFVKDFGSGTSHYGVSAGVDDVAFRNPNGSHVLIAYNTARTPQSFIVSWQRRQFSYTLPARATVTFIWSH
jgi:glucosylceramidase